MVVLQFSYFASLFKDRRMNLVIGDVPGLYDQKLVDCSHEVTTAVQTEHSSYFAVHLSQLL